MEILVECNIVVGVRGMVVDKCLRVKCKVEKKCCMCENGSIELL